LPWNLRVKFVKFRMSHKWFIPEYCGDLFIFGGVVFVFADSIVDWTCHGRRGGAYCSWQIWSGHRKDCECFLLMT
jgi:hypothetical protein